MKALFTILLSLFLLYGNSQSYRPKHARNRKSSLIANHKAVSDSSSKAALQAMQPRETATERYLKGPVRKDTSNHTTGKSTSPSSPFAGGVYAAANAGKTFDTASANRNNSSNQTTATTNNAIRNDTTYNANTIIENGITTNSGAVDRSGQTQFGQTNWGNGRSTVGESQWTIPPPVTASFSKEFPSANNANWTRNKTDTSIYSARYKSGASWITSNYNTAGERLDMRTEVPLIQPPQPVSVFMAKQPQDFRAVTISKLQIQGKPDVYEIQTITGKKIYVNNDGMEVNY